MLAGGGLLDGAPGYRSVSVSEDHQKIATVRLAVNARVWLSNPGVSDQGDYASADAQPAGDVAWGADGRVVFSSSRQGHRDIWLLDPATKNLQLATNSPYTDKSPVWVPGRNSVVFSSNRAGGYGIWRYDLNSSQYEQLTRDEYDDEPTISPDGTTVIYTKWKGSYSELWQVPINGGAGVRLAVGQARSPGFSPDGQLLLCMTRDDTPAANWRNSIVSLREGRVLRTLTAIPAGLRARWIPGTHEVAYIRTQGGVSNVVAYSLDSAETRNVTHFQEGQIEAMDWSPIGHRLALIRANRSSDAFLLLRKPTH
jgi:TolB protein